MEHLVPCKSSDRKRERQPISVPFVWEEKPGTPKKDWKPSARPIKPVELPVKLVASVPFGWEEKPGKPFPSFSQTPPVSEPAPPQTMSIGFPSPPRYSDSQDEDWSGSEGDIEDNREGDEMLDSELDTCSFVTGDSFSSAPSLLANGLISSSALLSAVPEQQTPVTLTTINGGQIQTPGSPETDSSTRSYATGTTSLAGASFLEWLFPRLAPRSSFLHNDGCSGKDNSHTADVQNIDFLRESNCSHVRRPLLTLGEMITMSRRMSYKRKASKIHKQPSMDLMKGNALGCCIFGPGNGISGLHRK
ncbi:hydroxyproline-rich glycoprotein family protein [Abeliophyllum distichum]|uniref:Hydroxyproline-rich glycoprotein family protein n=1 Tax=Abeliophyllum distichum TaxID=126358 RepID=A0ABD1VZL2_9LAMI